jgi:hypothetical protein
MKSHRFWIEIVLLAASAAFALALLLATLGAAAGAASGERESMQTSGPSQTNAQRVFEGMVTCSNCGAKHSPKMNRAASVCVRVCVHGGSNFALVSDDSTYRLVGNREALSKVAGERARITGIVRGQTITVVSALANT